MSSKQDSKGDTASDKKDENSTTVIEGSATMKFPADQESTVFYNPVQVQNRDLSILMISLYAERRAVRYAVKQKRKELFQANRKISTEELDKKLKEYEETLDGAQLLAQGKSQSADVEENAPSVAPGLTILEALAASGLRSVRYWKEIPGVKHVTINDLELAAVERAKENIQNNQLESVLLDSNVTRDYGICINHGDATHELYMSRRPQQHRPTPKAPQSQWNQQQPMWDVIDLDPYGSAAPFLDGAVQAVESGGLLCITCTDMAALGGSHPETAYGRYAALPIQSARYLQELALRILLHTVAVSAARYGRTIRPVLSVGMAFYVRIFVEIHNDKRGVNDLSLNIGHVYQSTKCSTFVTLPHGQMGGSKGNVYQSIRLSPSSCPETGAPFKVGGPMWLGPLHDKEIVATALERLSNETSTPTSNPNMELLATRKRLQGLLTSVSEELDLPLYYTLPDLSHSLLCNSPPLRKIMAGIANAGYDVSGFHKEPAAIKTNAPSQVVWDVMRTWAKQNPTSKAPHEESAAAKILAVEPSIEVDFTIPESFRKSKDSVTRFPLNPKKHWGPKRKATNSKRGAEDEEAEAADQPRKRAATNDNKND